MSLRAFHVFFIVISLLFSAAFSAWLIKQHETSWLIALNIAVALGLLTYLPWFIRKNRGQFV
jgi:hypothetical protein